MRPKSGDFPVRGAQDHTIDFWDIVFHWSSALCEDPSQLVSLRDHGSIQLRCVCPSLQAHALRAGSVGEGDLRDPVILEVLPA